MPESCPEEGPLLSRWEASNPRSAFGEGWGAGRESLQQLGAGNSPLSLSYLRPLVGQWWDRT